MSAEFGQLVRAAIQAKGISQGKTAALVGVYDDGRYLDATQVRLLMTGERKPSRGLVQRLIDVLAPHLDPAEAWAAAGFLPPGVTADMIRKLDLVATPANGVSARKVAQPLPLDVAEAEFAQLIDQNRPRLAVVVPLEPRRDRRRADEDRRRLRALPDVAA